MVTELQFVAVAAFLIWGLACSLCGVLTGAPDTAQLVWRDRGIKPEPPTDVLQTTSDRRQATAPTPTTDIAVASARPSIDPSLEAHAT